MIQEDLARIVEEATSQNEVIEENELDHNKILSENN